MPNDKNGHLAGITAARCLCFHAFRVKYEKIPGGKCKEEAERLERERKEEEHRIAVEKAKKKAKKVFIAIASVACVCAVFLILLKTVIIPKQRINKIKTAKVGDIVYFGTYEQDNNIANGKEKTQAILSVVKDLITESKDICFDGNGYSEEWKEEAKRRGLDCETSVPLIFDSYLKDDVVKMFEQTHVFTQVELQARNEVKWEIYTKKIQIEARVLGDLAINHIVPVATRYQSLLLDNVFKIKSLFPAEKSELIATQDMEVIEKIAFHLLTIKEKVHAMVEARKVANKIENEREKAIAYHDTVAPQLDDIRYHIDKLELMVDNEMWPLPKYRELLFIR